MMTLKPISAMAVTTVLTSVLGAMAFMGHAQARDGWAATSEYNDTGYYRYRDGYRGRYLYRPGRYYYDDGYRGRRYREYRW
jgi:hypothetical protein